MHTDLIEVVNLGFLSHNQAISEYHYLDFIMTENSDIGTGNDLKR